MTNKKKSLSESKECERYKKELQYKTNNALEYVIRHQIGGSDFEKAITNYIDYHIYKVAAYTMFTKNSDSIQVLDIESSSEALEVLLDYVDLFMFKRLDKCNLKFKILNPEMQKFIVKWIKYINTNTDKLKLSIKTNKTKSNYTHTFTIVKL